jgi:DNA-binding beta-propeller fold protein YncE/cytochrome c553
MKRPVRFLVFALSLAPVAAVTQTGVTTSNFVNFESAQTNPVRLTPDGTRLLAVNTADARLSVFDLTASSSAPSLVAEIPVGIDPVSVNARTDDEAWVVNQVSDSISVVSLSRGIVIDTLYVKDEPADVVFAGGLAFVSVARSNEVRVFDAATRTPQKTIPLAGESPRALATSPDGSKVYAAFALSGNRTTIVPASQAPPPPLPTNPSLPPAPQTGLIVDAADPTFSLGYSMPDNDVAEIDAATQTVARYFSRVGTVNLGIAVRPDTGDLYVANTNARNLERFEATLRGRFVDNRVTQISIQDGSTTPLDLNPGVGTLTTDEVRARALAQPTAITFDPSGLAYYVAAFGSDRVARVTVISGAIDVVDVAPGAGAGSAPQTKRGPRGLALSQSGDRLYVLNRIANTISTVDVSTFDIPVPPVPSEVPVGSFDPTPAVIRDGRGFLYDAKLSGNGTVSCASCHVDGEMDLIAWDLGNPAGTMQSVTSGFFTFQMHPMKGPMTTQTLRGLNGLEPLHWRGDRASFLAFNPAFESLMGRTQLSAADMAAYRDFINTIRFPPNPNQNLDRTLPASLAGGDPNAGRNTFLNEPFRAGVTCTFCHTIDRQGTNRTIIPSFLLGESQDFKVPHLRNLYEKTRFDNRPGAESIGGFGFIHDGSLPTLFDFLSQPVFGSLSTDTVRKTNVAAFLLAFDTGTAPAVGYARTINAANVSSADTASAWSLLEGQATSSNIDLILKGTIDGQLHGLLYRPSTNDYQTDRSGLGPFTRQQLAAKLTGDDVLTLMGVPPGSGVRMGIDRNVDGVLDGDVGPPPPPPSPAPVLHVASVLTTDSSGTPITSVVRGQIVFWRVRIVDAADTPAPDAAVTTVTTFNGTTIATATKTTGADGWALFSRDTRHNSRGTYTIQVSAVSKSGATYDPTANVQSATFTLR